MAANDRQVGGNWYKKGGEEHWDRQFRLFGPGYHIGQITKYVERYKEKNGVEDLRKAQHFLEKLIELELSAAADVLKTTQHYFHIPVTEEEEETFRRALEVEQKHYDALSESEPTDGSAATRGYTNQG